ncbi:hypothetical protein AAFF_G00165000 [Aldrovandia affinis]|uniref:Uncharacterized protein n=1 Tax=Aldrovandia affinis TaxID=143900 RepID=A0AAD7RM86_9TELE|nr:hypothetical protein AAFF_G00165000 [Aldrovandia affinis]
MDAAAASELRTPDSYYRVALWNSRQHKTTMADNSPYNGGGGSALTDNTVSPVAARALIPDTTRTCRF